MPSRTLNPVEAAVLGILSVGWRSVEELQDIFTPDVSSVEVERAVALLRQEKLVISWGRFAFGEEALHASEQGEMLVRQQHEETLRVYHRRRAQHAPLGSKLLSLGRRP